jgi:hypothetical protein
MIFSTNVSTGSLKTIEGEIELIIDVESFTLSADGLYVNYVIRLPGSGNIKLLQGQKFLGSSSPVFAALAAPITGFETVFKAIAPALVEEAL